MIHSKNSPIGFFDSGMGGLSVLLEVKKNMPCERFIYYGDNLNSPYGNYPDEKISELSKKGIDYLLGKEIKALVIACNTVTAAAIKKIRETAGVPVLGMEPAIKPAAAYTKAKKILVLATCATLRQKAYPEYEGKAEIIACPCENLAFFIENNYEDDEKICGCIRELLHPYKVFCYDSLVLGCTHYVLKKYLFEKVCGEGVKIFDGNYGLAANLKRILEKNGMLCDINGASHTKIILTKGGGEIYGLYKKILAGENSL